MTTSLLMSLTLSSIFLFPLMNQPLSLGLAVMISTMFLCMMVATYVSSWYGFILFLIYVGGLLVMFAYVASLSPNTLFGGGGPFFFLITAQFILPPLLFFFPFLDLTTLAQSVFNQNHMALVKTCGVSLASPMFISVLVGLAVILLINLVVVVKVCYYQQSALRPYKTK